MLSTPLDRAAAFCEAYDLQIPILLAPMAGACPPSLSIAVANGGGMGACVSADEAGANNQLGTTDASQFKWRISAQLMDSRS